MPAQPYKTRLYSMPGGASAIAWENRDTWRGQGIFLQGEDIDIPETPAEFPAQREHPPELAAAIARLLTASSGEQALPDTIAPTRATDGAHETDAAAAIYEAARVRLTTAPGTREYRPHFGVDTVAYLNRRITDAFVADIGQAIGAQWDLDSDWYAYTRPTLLDDTGGDTILVSYLSSDALPAPVNFMIRLAGA